MGALKEKLIIKSESGEPKGLTWLLIVLFLVLLSVAVMYFSGNERGGAVAENTKTPKSSSRAPRTYFIVYTSGVFSPTNLRIHAGDLVEFQNKTLFPVRISSGEQNPGQSIGFKNSGSVAPGGEFSFTFSAAGIFNYFNERDPNEAGAIIVKQ